jgi:two-component system, OmpR family, sensor histidine kinase MprB
VSLRVKLAVALAALAAAAAVSIGATSYRSTATSLNDEVDDSLASGASYVEHEWNERGDLDEAFNRQPPIDEGSPTVSDRDASEAGYTAPSRAFDGLLIQVLDRNGDIVTPPASGALPVDAIDRGTAKGTHSTRGPHDAKSGEHQIRILTIPVKGGAVQLGRSTDGVRAALEDLVERTMLTVLGVGVVAGLLGWWLARRLTQRLVALTAAAELVAATGDLSVPISTTGADEAGRLGSAIDKMLGSLAAARESQRRLVEDAGHEFRTPLTSLRTNIAVLRRNSTIPDDQHAQLLDDLDSESRELTNLVNELLAAAADRSGDASPEPTVLQPAVLAVIERIERRGGRKITLTSDLSAAMLPPGSLERAVGNMLDNATKFDDSDQPIEVVIDSGTIIVRDHGAGFARDDVDQVFDRFYRATSARSRPGSGLGLSIVREIAASNGGSARATNHPDGGAMVTLSFPEATREETNEAMT